MPRAGPFMDAPDLVDGRDAAAATIDLLAGRRGSWATSLRQALPTDLVDRALSGETVDDPGERLQDTEMHWQTPF